MGNLQICESDPVKDTAQVRTLPRSTYFHQELSRVDLPENSFIDISFLLDITQEQSYLRDLLESTYKSIMTKMLSDGLMIAKTQIYFKNASNELKVRDYKEGVKSFLEAESVKPYEYKVLSKFIELIGLPIPLSKNSMRILVVIGRFWDQDDELQINELALRLKKIMKNRFSILTINSCDKVFNKFREQYSEYMKNLGMNMENIEIGMKDEWEFIELMASKFQGFFDHYLKNGPSEAKSARQSQNAPINLRTSGNFSLSFEKKEKKSDKSPEV
jgi:hypothetical protein